MDDNKKYLDDLAKCLTEAGKILNQMNGSNSANTSTSTSTSTGLSSRMESAISSVGRTVNRAQSMVQNSTNRGRYSRLNGRERLRAISGTSGSSAPKKAKPLEKTFEFVLVNSRGQLNESDSFLLEDDAIILRGIVTLNSNMSEDNIRTCLVEAIVLKIPSVAPQDLEFLKAIRRKLSKPVNAGEFSFKEVKLLAGQGSIYITMKDGFECLLDDYDRESNPKEQEKDVREKEGQETPPLAIQDGANNYGQNEADRHHESFVPSQNQQEEDDSDLLKSAWGGSNDVESAVKDFLKACEADKITNPVEVLRCAQKYIVKGRPLDTTETESNLEGDVNFIDVNRQNLLQTAFDEIEDIENYQLTLQVTFYGEVAYDNGGPRKEFFRLCLRAIKEKYFDNGLRNLFADDYEKVGIIMALSILQNGPVPKFLDEAMLQELFQETKPSPCILKLRIGFAKLGLYQIANAVPQFVHLMRPSQSYQLSKRKLISLLAPSFSDEGSNAKMYEMGVYEVFLRYVREATSGRRAAITLGHILQFVTGAEEEPVLGFAIPPSICFTAATSKNKWAFVPTSNTCTQTLYLPTGSHECPLPSTDELFEIYDSAFVNVYFGLA